MLRYWLWLSTRKGLGPLGACQVARHFSGAEQAYFAPAEAYRELEGICTDGLLDKDLSQADRIIGQCAEAGIRIITMQDASYPTRLRTLDDAPVVLYCKGNLQTFDVPSIAVIGTRKSSVYGLTQAKRFGYGLARCGSAVVSGGALGVDAEAMRGGVLADGTVIAVLGCGLDVDYPKPNRRLFDQVMERGCLISEFPPGTAPFSHNFPRRNRIMSGMSLGVLVTEAPAVSGALITADHALQQGRDVFVLPANIGVENFAGNLKLLRDGAIPVGTPWDILQEYAAQYPQLKEKPEEEPLRAEAFVGKTEKKVIDKPKTKAYIDLKDTIDTLTSQERALAELLQGGAMHIDDLVEKTGMTAGEALASLTVLEVKKIVCRPSVRMYELAEK